MEGRPRRERVHLSWIPVWEGKIEGWAKKFIRRNQWRCDGIHSVEDLIQDAYLIYRKIYERYPRIIDPPHFMSLFQRALRNNFNDHSRYTRRKRLVHAEIADHNYADCFGINMDYNPGPLLSCIADLPEEVKQALILLQTQPELFREPTNGPRENLNAKLWRILGCGNKRSAGGRERPSLRIDYTGILQSLVT